MATNEDMKVSKLFSVKDKVAVVTGGATGIGLMCVQALAANGARVYIVGRRKEKLDNVVDHYGKNIPGSIHAIQGDMTSKDDITKVLKHVESKEKFVNILVNNAGKGGGISPTAANDAEHMSKKLFHDHRATIESWTDVYQTNVPHIFFMTMAFLPLLQKATEPENGGDGNVINISSISGQLKTAQNHFSYNATKAAVIHVTNMLAREIAENALKVRVNSISPGIFPSELTAMGKSNEVHKSQAEDWFWKGIVPANREGTDQDMGNICLFLATNSYVNGQTVTVDGGYLLRDGTKYDHGKL